MDKGSPQNTAFEYVYRDASNYKWFDTIIVEGSLKMEDIQRYLIDREFFIPQEVGLKSLTPEIRNDDDHDWHAIFSLKPTSDTPASIDAKTLIDRFRSQYEKSWQFV